MEKNIVKGFLGKNGQKIFITSEQGKAVSYTGNSNFKMRTELGLEYGGSTLEISFPPLFRRSKAALELTDASCLTYDGENIHIGKISAEAVSCGESPAYALFEGADCGTFKFSGDGVKRLMHLADCASTDERCPFMNGVFFNANGEIAATDAHRLCVWKTETEYPKVIVHREAFQFFTKSKELQITVKNSGVRIIELTDGKTVVRTTEVEGNFPNYTRVIPDKKDYAEGETFNIDFKKYGDYIKSTKPKPVLQLFNDAVYCCDMQIGSLNFNIDPLVITAKYLRDSLENVGEKVAWRKIQEKTTFIGNIPVVQNALIFGDDSYCDVVMPVVTVRMDETSEAFRGALERIARKNGMRF